MFLAVHVLAAPLAVLAYTHLRPSQMRDWLRAATVVAAPVVGMLRFAYIATYGFNGGLTRYLTDQPIDVLNTGAALVALGLRCRWGDSRP